MICPLSSLPSFFLPTGELRRSIAERDGEEDTLLFPTMFRAEFDGKGFTHQMLPLPPWVERAIALLFLFATVCFLN